MRSRPVHRIGEVRSLRARQFPEDAGPLRHPVRPNAYAEINNFYTATVYDKGAEIVRMLRTLIGPAAFRAGMDRYFADNDGRAATVEDFLAAFAAETGRDLSAFARWYERPGTPRLTARTAYDAAKRTFTLRLAQSLTEQGPPLVIPVALGLVGADGPLDGATCPAVTDGVFVLETREAELVFENVAEEPVPSLLRDFSAPVKLDLPLSDEARLRLLARDSDPFNRWQAAQDVALRLILDPDAARADAFADALGVFLDGEALSDPAFAALVLALPTENEAADALSADVDPDAIHAARRESARPPRPDPPFAPGADRCRPRPGAGRNLQPRRGLRRPARPAQRRPRPHRGGRSGAGASLAAQRLDAATNMTDRLAALSTLSQIPGETREAALSAFGERYANEPLVLDKWFAIQAMIGEDGTLARVDRLKAHPAFSMTNPNRVRALIASFAMGNPTQFARADGAGFALVAETVKVLDAANPQVAARLLTAFGSWRRYEKNRRAVAAEMLSRIKAVPGLSRDVADILGRTLKDG